MSKKPQNQSSSYPTVRVTLVRSTNRRRASHKACVRGLGLRRMNSSVELSMRPEIRGMINAVSYLLKVEEL